MPRLATVNVALATFSMPCFLDDGDGGDRVGPELTTRRRGSFPRNFEALANKNC